MGYDDDERAVVIDGDDEAAFARDYHPDHEEGWCLYGSINESHVRVDDVAHAAPISTSADRIEFTCAGETADQALAGENPRLIGTVHSHPSKDRESVESRRYDDVGADEPGRGGDGDLYGGRRRPVFHRAQHGQPPGEGRTLTERTVPAESATDWESTTLT